jgi:hypothetical protein
MIKKFKKFNIIPCKVILFLRGKLKNNNRYLGIFIEIEIQKCLSVLKICKILKIIFKLIMI